jgi:hypothetical protein
MGWAATMPTARESARSGKEAVFTGVFAGALSSYGVKKSISPMFNGFPGCNI